LAEVARLVGATIRTGPGGDRVSVVGRHGRLDLVRDSAQVTVGSRVVDLGTPVRVRQGRWQVPGELLVRALPALLGTGAGHGGGGRRARAASTRAGAGSRADRRRRVPGGLRPGGRPGPRPLPRR